MWPRDCSCNVLVKNGATFCPKSPPEAKVKRFQLIPLTKEVSEKSSTDFVLLLTLTKNALMKSSKLRKEKYKMYGSNNERAQEVEWSRILCSRSLTD